MSIFRTMQSESDPNKEYLVSIDRFGKWRCECPDWVHTTQRNKKFFNYKCKHLKKLLDELGK